MPDDARIPLFIRVPPQLKEVATMAAWRRKMSVSRFAEVALREKIEREEIEAEVAQ